MAAAANHLPEQVELFKHDGTVVLLRFLSKIGRGGQGTVYKATIDGTVYAVKSAVLRFQDGKYNRTALNAERVIAENIGQIKNAETNASSSRHICNFYGIIERLPGDSLPPNKFVYYDRRPLDMFETPRFYFIYELVTGETLTRKIASGLSARAVEEYGRQLLQACVAFHSAKIAHNDIKPDNIMINDENILKLIDYGLSCRVKKCIVGGVTPEYGAPELMEQSGIDKVLVPALVIPYKTDIFSVGCILYEMITGHKLHEVMGFAGPYRASQLPDIRLSEDHRRYEPLLRRMVSFDGAALGIHKAMYAAIKKRVIAEHAKHNLTEHDALIASLKPQMPPFGHQRPTALEALTIWNTLHPSIVMEAPAVEATARVVGNLPEASIGARAVVGEIIAAENGGKKGGKYTRKGRLSRKRRTY